MAQEDKLEELREATRLANQVLKDLKQERKEIIKLLDGIPGKVAELVGDSVVKQLEELGKLTQKAMDDSIARVDTKFEEYSAILLGEDKKSKAKGELSLKQHAKLIAFRNKLHEEEV